MSSGIQIFVLLHVTTNKKTQILQPILALNQVSIPYDVARGTFLSPLEFRKTASLLDGRKGRLMEMARYSAKLLLPQTGHQYVTIIENILPQESSLNLDITSAQLCPNQNLFHAPEAQATRLLSLQEIGMQKPLS